MADSRLEAGSSAPQFTLPDQNEAELSLSDLKGHAARVRERLEQLQGTTPRV